jgi:hypothetical protein
MTNYLLYLMQGFGRSQIHWQILAPVNIILHAIHQHQPRLLTEGLWSKSWVGVAVAESGAWRHDNVESADANVSLELHGDGRGGGRYPAAFCASAHLLRIFW